MKRLPAQSFGGRVVQRVDTPSPCITAYTPGHSTHRQHVILNNGNAAKQQINKVKQLMYGPQRENGSGRASQSRDSRQVTNYVRRGVRERRPRTQQTNHDQLEPRKHGPQSVATKKRVLHRVRGIGGIATYSHI